MNEKILSKIEVFLEAISEINSLLQYQIKYEYSFKKLEITGNIKNGFKDFIISKYIEFSDKNPDWNCNVEEFRLKMDNLFDLIEIAFLSKSFIENLRQWFLIRYIDDLKKIYKLNNTILICKQIYIYKGEGSSGFSIDSIFKYFANFFSKDIDIKRYKSIYIGAKPGIPDVRLSIENLSLIYARDKVIIFDQDEISGKIIRSKTVENRLFYELINILEQSLNNYDFSAAYNFISDSAYNQNYIKKNNTLYQLLEISYKWLYESSEEGLEYCNNFLICEKDRENLILVEKMKGMLNDNLINIIEKTIIRSIDQLYHGKYLMAMVLLNIAVENIPFIIIDMEFPGILVFKNKRKYIDLDKLPNLNIGIKKFLIEECGYEKSLVYDNNIVLFKIFKEYEKRDNIKKANFFIIDMKDFKEKRNYFLHTGNEPKKEDILKIFGFRNSEINIQMDDIDSVMIEKLLDICKYLTGYSYCNWISEMSNLCLKTLKNIEIS